MTNKALVLVDFENEWTDKNSEYFVGNIEKVITRINRLIDFCRKKRYKIIFTTHIEKDSNKEFKENSKNVEIISNLHKEKTDILIKKNKISPFYKTSLDKELKGIKQIIVCGILTNLCVRSLAQDAYDREFEIIVIKNCCVSFDKKTQNFTFKDLKETREKIEFLNVDEFVNN